MNTTKMNKQIKNKKTITCSTCGKTGHNKNNEKFHPIVVEEEDDDGFEDCNFCGYIHHYEDKCPNETTCEHYEKSAPKILDSHTDTSCEILPMTPNSEVSPDPQKIDHFFQEGAERQKNNKTMNTTKMNKQIKNKKTITCSTCGKTGHNKNNEKFHPIVVEEDDDGFEDCDVCGYIHHYEDKCPNETTCEHYEKSAPKILDSHTDTSCEILPMTPNSEVSPDPQKIDHFFQEGAERQKNKETMNTTKMNTTKKTQEEIDAEYKDITSRRKAVYAMNEDGKLAFINSHYKMDFSKLSVKTIQALIKKDFPDDPVSYHNTKAKCYHAICQFIFMYELECGDEFRPDATVVSQPAAPSKPKKSVKASPKVEPILSEKELKRKERDDAIRAERALEDALDEQDLIIIKGGTPEPIPTVVVAPAPVKKTVPKPVFLKRKNRGECGVDGDTIAFPLLQMGCCEDPRGLVMTVTIPIPDKIDKEFLVGFAEVVKKFPYFDWSGESFMRNIIRPNREHIQMVMGLDDFFLKRVMEDLHVVISHWYEAEIDEDDSDYGEDYVPLNHTTFFTDRNCEY